MKSRNDHDKLANLYITRGMTLRFKSNYTQAIEIAQYTQSYVDAHNLDPYFAYQAARLEGLALYHMDDADKALKYLTIHYLVFRASTPRNLQTGSSMNW